MKSNFSSRLMLCGLLMGFCPALSHAQSAPVAVTVTTDKPGAAIAPDFIGLSFEMQALLPHMDGRYMFAPDNAPLLAMFKQLGIKSLRVGGNTADNPAVKVPQGADIDSLYAFAKAANVHVIYTLRLRGDVNPSFDAQIAKYVYDRYKPLTTCLAIGNEPNMYAKTYPAYLDMLKRFIDVINAADVAPDATYCGPSTTPGKAEWARDLAKDMGPSGKIAFISQHSYPGGGAKKVTDPSAARDAMLSPKWLNEYQKMYDAFVPAAIEHKLPYRLEETNSFFSGGAKDVSDTFASALWALDYLHWWAAHGCAGLNFHTGDKVASADASVPCRYAVWWTSNFGYTPHPIAYGIKAFDLGSHGRTVPITLDEKDKLNLTAYAVEGDETGHPLYVTLINKEHGDNPHAAAITLPGGKYTHGQMISLTSPGNDPSATGGTKLGGAAITDDGGWTGTWDSLTIAEGKFVVNIPATAAVVVKLTAE